MAAGSREIPKLPSWRGTIRPILIRRWRAFKRWVQSWWGRMQAQVLGKSSTNALQDRNSRHGELSYYYAHSVRSTGDKPAPQQGPVLLRKGSETVHPSAAEAGTSSPSAAGTLPDKHGKNYYYAHASSGNTADLAAPMPKEGGVLLERTVSAPAAAAAVAAAVAIQSFSFYDDGERVKVYLPWERANEIPKADIDIQFGKESFCFTVAGGAAGPKRQLRIARLLHEIVPAKCKYSAGKNKFTITLAKLRKETPWSQLRANAVSSEED